jgi:drug/metabolite transporter (DMT)-like permease
VLAIVLALGSALCWGISDYLGGLKSRSLALLSVLLVSQFTGALVLFMVVIVTGGDAPEGRQLLFAVGAGLGEILGVAALYRGLAVGSMSIVAPVASVAPVVPLLAGFAFGEFPALLQVAGLVFIIAGLVLTARKPSVDTAGSRGRVGASFLFGGLSALGFGVFFVLIDSASESGIPWALFSARLTAVAVLAIVIVMTRSRIVVRSGDLPVTSLIGILILSADFMYATATGIGLLGVVAVLGALHTVVTIFLARVFLKERIGTLQRIGVAVCVCGVLAVTAFPSLG